MALDAPAEAVNTSRKGNGAAVQVSVWLEEDGWIIGDRRNRPGAGDLTANRLGDRPLLIEVKSSSRKRGAYADFPPADRDALRLAAIGAGMVPALAWKPSPSRPAELVFQQDWPG